MAIANRRQLAIALAIAALLIFLRSAVFIVYEQSFFDSDQAIVGLMAKHLLEGRAFPLFYYGQTYMLGVDAWVTAPVFLLLGPTVAALHIALTLCNVAVAWLLIIGLSRWGGVRPLIALAACSFFILSPPLTTASLIEAGANIGPFVYVAVLWMLRRRPFWFGGVLGLGVLHREFTVYAVPAILAGEMWTRELLRAPRVRFWLLALIASLGTWQGIQALTPYADIMGPGTRGEIVGGAGSQLGNIAQRVSVDRADLPHRARVLFGEQLPRLYAVLHTDDNIGPQGRDGLFWPFVMVMGLALSRAGALMIRRPRAPAPAYSLYLIAVGGLAVLGVLLTRPAGTVADRYVLLTLLIPTGVVALYLATEPRLWLRRLMIAAVAVWAGSSVIDHARQVIRYAGGREPNEMRDLVTGLEARGIHVAEAGYWRAYRVSFLSRESVKVASTDVVRITEYQRLASDAGPALVRIAEGPCEGGEAVSQWYLCQ